MTKKQMLEMIEKIEEKLIDFADRIDEGVTIDNRMLGHWERIMRDIRKEIDTLSKLQGKLEGRK